MIAPVGHASFAAVLESLKERLDIRRMYLSKIAIIIVLSALAGGAPAFAQAQEPIAVPQSDPGPLSDQKFNELAKWVREYYAWEAWFELWGNRVARNFADQHLWERKKRPEPPVWLEEECHGYRGVDGLLVTACSILRGWDDHPLRILQRRRSGLVTSGGKVDEKVVKSSFFQRVHVTGLWTRAQYPATPIYGIVGMQVAVFEVGRLTLPAVGVMVVMFPDGEGRHYWKSATTVGFGYRISDFVLPWINRPASLHINVARTNVQGVDENVLTGANFNFIGLSISGRKSR